MKKILIGSVFSLVGSILILAVMIMAASNLTDGWTTPPGRFISTILNLDVMHIFVLGVCLLILGIIILFIELFKDFFIKFFRKDKR